MIFLLLGVISKTYWMKFKRIGTIKDIVTVKRYCVKIIKPIRHNIKDLLVKEGNIILFIFSYKCTQLGIEQHLGFDPDGGCPDFNRQCIQWYPNYPNDTMRRHCNESVPCSSCWEVRILMGRN